MARQHIVLAALSAWVAMVLPALAQDREWRDREPQRYEPQAEVEVLGTSRLNSRTERMEFQLDPRQIEVLELRLRAGDAAMLIQSVDLVLTDGRHQPVQLMDRLGPGEQSRPIAIDPRWRGITKVIVLKRPSFRPGETTLQLLGKVRHIGADFEVGGGADRVITRSSAESRQNRITFNVGRDKGLFKAIKFRALDKGLLMNRIDINFAGGGAKTVDAIGHLIPGQVTSAISLDGEPRFIESVTLWKRPSWRPGRVDVELIGIPAPPPRPPQWGGLGPKIPRGWVLFGAQEAGFTSDRDTVTVGEEFGRFERIALRIDNNDLYLRELTIVYDNGERDRKVIETAFSAGTQTRPIDLRGDRFIREIQLQYQSNPDRRKPAVVEVFGDFANDWVGEYGRYRGHRGGWLMLGAERASMFGKDRDAIVVNPRVGRIKAIRIAARRAPVRFYGARIVYANGEAEDLPISGQLKDGDSSQPIDLRGRGGRIDRIELKYRSKLDFKGEGIVEVWGLG